MNLGRVQIVDYEGDIFDTEAEAFVNPWNRNFVPRWGLNPGGISGALKRLTGAGPWATLHDFGMLHLGDAVVTGPGNWPGTRMLIHVAGLNMLWRASRRSVTVSAQNALIQADQHGARTVALPLIGAGHGGLDAATSRSCILEGIKTVSPRITHAITVYLPAASTS